MCQPDHSSDSARTAEFELATARVNEWRGSMIENYAQAEQAVSRTLLSLVDADFAPAGTKLPHMVGQRFAALAKILAAPTRPLPHAQPAISALEGFQRNEVLRAALCHGAQKVALEKGGDWVLLLKMMIFKPQGASSFSQTLEQSEAIELLRQLEQDRARLASALGQLRRAGRQL